MFVVYWRYSPVAYNCNYNRYYYHYLLLATFDHYYMSIGRFYYISNVTYFK